MDNLQSNFVGIETRQYVFHWRGKMKTDLFSNVWEGHAIRRVEKDGEWWWVAADVCKALDIDDAGQAVAQAEYRLKEAEVSDPFSKRITLPVVNDSICDVVSNYITLPVDPAKPKARKTQTFVCVNEGGLYELILASRKKEAIKFRHWVTHTVLPALRKAGLDEKGVFSTYTLPTNGGKYCGRQ
jgi:prophage antirepressor-like protein